MIDGILEKFKIKTIRILEKLEIKERKSCVTCQENFNGGEQGRWTEAFWDRGGLLKSLQLIHIKFNWAPHLKCLVSIILSDTNYAANSYVVKINNRCTRKICEIC